MTERQLVKRAKEGCIESFEELILAHEKRVYNIALKMLKNTHNAFDASQEAFIKAFRSIGSFKEQASVGTWLYRITVNVCLDMLRKEQDAIAPVSIDKSTELDDGNVEFQLEDKNADTEERILEAERSAFLHKAIDSLSVEHREMIILRDIEGFSYEEIANITKKNIGTVKSKINRARAALKNILEKNKELFYILIVLILWN